MNSSWAAQFGVDAASSDNRAALQLALKARGLTGGGVVRLGPGTFNLSSAGLAVTPLDIPNGVTLHLDPATRLVVTGNTASTLIRLTNRTNVAIEGGTIRGNSRESGTSVGQLVYWEWTSGTGGGEFAMRRVRLENCAGADWVGIYNSTDNDVSGFTFDALEWDTEVGNDVAPHEIGWPASLLTIGDNSEAASGRIRDVLIRNFRGVNVSNIKRGLQMWHQAHEAQIDGLTGRNWSSANSNQDVGRYVITIYRGSAAATSGLFPTRIQVGGVDVNGFGDCGLYSQSGNQIEILPGNLWEGGTGTVDATLPKGAIAINNGIVTIHAQTIRNCVRGIQVVAGSTTVVTSPDRSKIYDVPLNGQATKAIPVTGSINGIVQLCAESRAAFGVAGYTAFNGDGTAASVIAQLDLDLWASGIGTGVGLQFVRSNADVPAASTIRIKARVTGAGVYGLDFRSWSNAAQRCTIDLDVRNVTGTGYGADLSGSNVIIKSAHFADVAAGGRALVMGGTVGTVQNVTFDNVAVANRVDTTGGVDLGRDVPTHTGAAGDMVQDCITFAADASGMRRIGWFWAGAWVPMFISTVSPATRCNGKAPSHHEAGISATGIAKNDRDGRTGSDTMTAMTKDHQSDQAMSQIDKSKEAAHVLETDPDEARFDERLRRIVKHKPVEEPA